VPLHRFSFPTAIQFGPGARHQAAPTLQAAGVRRPLLVTDRGLAALPPTAEMEAHLRGAGLAVARFAGVWGNPTAAQVAAGAAAYRDHGADAVVGFGGGAALDVAKAVALLASHPGDILEYAWDHPSVRPIQDPLPFFLALPTTSGTGSEVGRSAVISEDASHVKRIIFSPALLAKAVLADPELTFGLPAAVTAATGIDALTHNVESYLSPAYHPLCDGVALEGARIAARALPLAVAEPGNLQGRSDMMMASLMGGIAFQKDLGAVHSCAHALGAVANLHHGLANGIMLDHVMRFNAAAAPAQLGELARVCGAGATAADFVAWLAALKARIGLPPGLRGSGVTADQVDRLAEVALADPCHRTNPRPCTREDFAALFTAALAA
jgi:alcohol dehydrogenase class IV